jgi:serine/threonine protein kinase
MARPHQHHPNPQPDHEVKARMHKGQSLETGLEPFPGYRLTDFLGRGGFGEVWQAEQATGATVALKFMPVGDTLAAAKELRAIQAVRRLKHPHLVRIDQVWAIPGYLVIAMELAEGSLHDLLDLHQEEFGAPLAPEQVCEYLSQAASALDFLNDRRHQVNGQLMAFQHCDIKPSNLLLFGDTVKLCDFGLSAALASALTPHRRAGTPAYTAPELFHNRLSRHTDQYSLAMTYCKLRGDRLPFSGTTAKLDEEPQRAAPDLSMLSQEERPIIARALSLAPPNRWPSCGELMARLTEAVLGLSQNPASAAEYRAKAL